MLQRLLREAEVLHRPRIFHQVDGVEKPTLPQAELGAEARAGLPRGMRVWGRREGA